MDEERKAARWRKRRLIYNNDGSDVYEAKSRHDVQMQFTKRSGGQLRDDFLNARSTPLVGTQVDSIWYCSCLGGVMFSHHTKLSGFLGKEIPRELVDKYGCDNLQIQLDFCREHDIEAFWSVRMNDTHDSYPAGPWRYGLAPFKREHSEYMMGEPDDWERYPEGPRHEWSSLDFSYPEVREHIFSLIQEVCQGYEVDGVELDFLRHPKYFAPTVDGLPAEEQHLEIMTDLVRRISSMAGEVGRQRGRPLLLAARTPYSVEGSRFVGLDVEKWLQEDLIDILIAGGLHESIMTESFREIVDLGHQYDGPVYPCISWGFWQWWAFLDLGAGRHRTLESWHKTLRRENTPSFVALGSWEGTMAAWRGAAMNLWNASPDGIYIFNGFHATSINIFRELGDPETMANKDKIFGVDRFERDSSFKNVREMVLNQGEPVSIHFQVGDVCHSEDISALRFRLHFWDFADNDHLAVKLNHQPLHDLRPVDPIRTPLGAQWLECQLDPAQVQRGENRVELMVRKRDESMQTPLVLDTVQLHVRSAAPSFQLGKE